MNEDKERTAERVRIFKEWRSGLGVPGWRAAELIGLKHSSDYRRYESLKWGGKPHADLWPRLKDLGLDLSGIIGS